MTETTKMQGQLIQRIEIMSELFKGEIPYETLKNMSIEELDSLYEARVARKLEEELDRNRITKKEVKWNIKKDEEIKNISETVLDTVADVLSNTFGPFGSHTIVEDQTRNHHMTKDGFTVLKKINFVDPTMNAINKMLYDIAFNLVVKVGDGSTSSIIAARELYKELQDLISRYPKTRKKLIFDTISNLSDILVKKIQIESKPISDDFRELEYIASVSTNNDMMLGKLIRELYTEVSRYGKISIDISNTDKTYYETANGFKFRATMMDKLLINNKALGTNELKDVDVIMFKGSLTGDMDEIGNLINYTLSNKRKLVIIANSFGESASNFFSRLFSENDHNYLNTRFNILYMPLLSDNDIELFNELAIYADAKIIRSDQDEVFTMQEHIVENNCLGQLGTIVAKHGGGENIIVTGGKGQETNKEQIENIVEGLKLEIARKRNEFEESIVEDIEVVKLEHRLLNFSDTASIATLYIGGQNMIEKETQRYLIEDAIQACESAIKYGYNIGGNLIIPIVIRDLIAEYDGSSIYDALGVNILHAILKAFKSVFRTVYKNKYNEDFDEEIFKTTFDTCISKKCTFNLITDEFDDNTIINSTRTDIEILRSTLSIISLLLLSNQYISLIPDNIMDSSLLQNI